MKKRKQNKAVIPGGFYIKARAIQNSSISHAPPHVREVWEYLLRKANFADTKYNGRLIKRGQLICSWRSIQEGLHWKVGYRKMRYSQSKIENATKWLMKAEMVAGTKTKRGRIITILNYELYQNPANYDCRHDCRHESRPSAECSNKKNKKDNNNNYSPNSDEFRLSQLLLDLIIERKPDYLPGQPPKKEKTLQSWAVHIDRMIRIDRRDPDRIEKVIRWCQQDDFWQNNILSAEKLRKQFDKLELKMPQADARQQMPEYKEQPNAKWLADYRKKGVQSATTS